MQVHQKDTGVEVITIIRHAYHLFRILPENRCGLNNVILGRRHKICPHINIVKLCNVIQNHNITVQIQHLVILRIQVRQEQPEIGCLGIIVSGVELILYLLDIVSQIYELYINICSLILRDSFFVLITDIGMQNLNQVFVFFRAVINQRLNCHGKEGTIPVIHCKKNRYFFIGYGYIFHALFLLVLKFSF